jgi:HEAT repeat protein
VGRFAVFVVAVALGLAAGVWYSREIKQPRANPAGRAEPNRDDWIERLHSRNPQEAADAAKQLTDRGADALPAIRAVLEDPQATRARRKAALKASALLGPTAAPLVDAIAAELEDPDVTAEAGVALSFMGPAAFPPLRAALESADPGVRREALRSIGKLKERAPLEPAAVLPLLLSGMSDADPGVRTVAATYLGIIHEGGKPAVGALVAALSDPEAEVRRAAATALGSFGAPALPALPALKKAATDPDENVAREAGLALVKLQPNQSKK